MQTYTAPLAIIKLDGFEIGKARNIRCNEGYRRGRITGIGRASASELPMLEFTGTVTMGFYNINFARHPSFAAQLNGFNRELDTPQNLLNVMMLQEKGFDLILLQKVVDSINSSTKIITMKNIEFATIFNLFITGDNFELSEGQISGRDSSFEYTDPISFPVPS